MPTPDTFPTVAQGGPQYARFLEPAPDWDEIITETKFDDGGVSYAIHADTPTRTFIFEYTGLSLVEAKILDDHRESAKGKYLGFVFVHPRTNETIEDVHYMEFEKDHNKLWSQRRRISLIKRP